jgi:acid phosphatase
VRRNGIRGRLAAVLSLALALMAIQPEMSLAGRGDTGRLDQVQRFVVIYQENHSFDAVLGNWEGVDGIDDAPPGRTVQVDQNGRPYGCLLQNDPSLNALEPKVCDGFDASGNPFQSALTNDPFAIGELVPSDADTCPDKYGPKLTGCTLDLNHDFYQSRYQLNDGRMNRFASGNDVSAGLTMGHWGTHGLPVYDYLHQPNHPDYAIADRFFQAAFGGSFLNHQWLISARTPTWPDADNGGTISDPGNDVHSVVDSNAMPTTYDRTDKSHPSLLYESPLPEAKKILVDGPLTASCDPRQAGDDTRPAPPPGTPCGDYAINTINPSQQPTHGAKRAELPLQPRSAETIGDRLTDAGKSWAWYSAGWSNADGDVGKPGWTNGDGPVAGRDGTDCPDKFVAKDTRWPFCPDVRFTYHHQPFNYYEAFSRDTSAGRRNRERHLRDLERFKQLVDASDQRCQLRRVSFVKFMRDKSEHPGVRPYPGDAAATNLIQDIEGTACAPRTMVILTYDEYGGAWDHVPPPGQADVPGPHDQWGPGPRIPAIIVSPLLGDRYVVDHTEHDTTSIMATIEHRFGLPPVNQRDADANDLGSVFSADPP